MAQNAEWPNTPTGVRIPSGGDARLRSIYQAIQDDNADRWFTAVQPPDSPSPQVASLPGYDHEEELEAVPEEPTEEYRQRAMEYLGEVIDAKEKVRPPSLSPADELPGGIIRKTSKSWIHYHTTGQIGEREDDRDSSAAEVTRFGKYLFFTPGEMAPLEEIIIEQFQDRPFSRAKVPSQQARNDDAVLCLYYTDDRYKSVLGERYRNEPPK